MSMPKKQKRDNAYYLDVVERKHPAIYARYLAGDFASASAAILAAGVRKPPKQIHVLKSAWSKATSAEKRAFIAWIKAMPPKSAASVPMARPISTPDHHLTADAKKRIKTLFPDDPFPNAIIMKAIGGGAHDTSLGMAIVRDTTLQPALIALLETWLPAEEARRKKS